MNLFAYGTLMEPRVLRRVTGLTPRTTSATLTGFRRLAFKNECYPGIVPATAKKTAGEMAGEIVIGKIFFDLSDTAWPPLDAFESAIYERVGVDVLANTREKIKAEVYIVKGAYRHLLTDRDWDFDYFLNHDLDQYLDAD